MIEFLLKIFQENNQDDAMIWRDQTYSYGWLYERVAQWQAELSKQNVTPGSVVILEGDFSPNAVALFLALIENNCILVPLTKLVGSKKMEFTSIAEGEIRISIADDDSVNFERQHFFHIFRQIDRPRLNRQIKHSGGAARSPIDEGKRNIDRNFELCPRNFDEIEANADLHRVGVRDFSQAGTKKVQRDEF